MGVFETYARYYNLLYADKDYQAEARYVADKLGGVSRSESILDLGCGTGAHAHALAHQGFEVWGVDMSDAMLRAAQARRDTALEPTRSRMHFIRGDLREVRLNRAFSHVTCLFHAMSYQCSNQDLKAAFATASQHLAPGGRFLFDVWYGPAVLSQRPEVRVKRVEDDSVAITRIAEPTIRWDLNVVDVDYELWIKDKATGAAEHLRETHQMRYLFHGEIAELMNQVGLTLSGAEEYLTGRVPNGQTWSVCYVAIAGKR